MNKNGDYEQAGSQVSEDKQDKPKSEQDIPDTHEKFMRVVSKQTLENLIELKNDIKAIKSWIVLFGVVSVIALLVSILF